MYVLVDCDNCFVSCERVFQPELKGRPVVVLSNNDGCVVARSNEAKALGIKMGVPLYQIQGLVAAKGVQLRSSNYTLYADLSNRIMSILRQEAPVVEVYSIDEAFLDLRMMGEDYDYEAFGHHLVQKIGQWVGMPVSIGIAPTRTLAKMASWYAKHYPGYRKVCYLSTDVKREKALRLFDVAEVWGVGWRRKDRLYAVGIHTAWDLVQKPAEWIRREMSVTGLRTWRELQGEDCIPYQLQPRRQTICTSRSFAEPVTTLKELEMYVSNYASRCAAKLRREHSACSLVTVFANTSPFRQDLPQYSPSLTLTLQTPVSSTPEIVGTALKALRLFFREGYQFKRAGVIVSATSDANAVQTNLFDEIPAEQRARFDKLSAVIDKINVRMGADTLKMGVQQLPKDERTGKDTTWRDGIRHDYRSRNYTTDINEILEVE